MLPLFVQTVLVILGVLCFGYAIKRVVKQKKLDCLLFLLGGLVLVFAEYFSWIDGYWLSVIKFMGLNVIFATSLNCGGVARLGDLGCIEEWIPRAGYDL